MNKNINPLEIYKSIWRFRMKTIIISIYFFIIIGYFIWPFKFVFQCEVCPNGASWAVKENGIEFQTPGLLRSLSPPIGLYERLTSGKGLTIVAWLTTARLNQVGPARIVSYSQDPFFRNFTLGQENGDLVFRLRTTRTNLNGMNPEFTVPGTFVPGKRQHIVMTYDHLNYRFYVDGQLRKSEPAPGGTFSNWDPDYQLLIGNEQTGNRPWIGGVERVVVYDRPFSPAKVVQAYRSGGLGPNFDGVAALFEFTECEGSIIHDTSGVQPGTNLELSAFYFNEGTRDFLSLKPRDMTDVLSNFLILFPFGFLLFLNLSKVFGAANLQSVAITFLATVLFSLAAESLQYYVEARTSSLFDFASCIAGGVSGSLVAMAFKPFHHVS